MEPLKSAVSITNLREIQERSPEKLDEYYEAAWTRIIDQGQTSRELAHHTIAWVFQARRLLQVGELQHALAVRLGDEAYNAENSVEVTAITEMYHGLVLVEQQSQTVRLTHPTFYTFFQRRDNDFSMACHEELAKTCMTYLCFDTFEKTTYDFDSIVAVRLYAKPGE